MQIFFVALRAMAFEFISAVEELLDYEPHRRTTHLLKQAKRAA
jgi:hypothetical protein